MCLSALRRFREFYPDIGARVMIDPSCVVIGQVSLADDVSLWPGVVARGDVNRITLGARTNIQDGTVLHVTHCSDSLPEGHPLTIGQEVTVGHKAMLHGCTVGDRVLIGMGAIVLDGAHIEEEVMLGAGSLVPPGKRLESGYLYIGSPARKIRPLSEEEKLALRRSAENYVRWKENYLAEDSQYHPSASS